MTTDNETFDVLFPRPIDVGQPDFKRQLSDWENKKIGWKTAKSDSAQEIEDLKEENTDIRKQIQYWKDFCEKVKKLDYNEYFKLQAHTNELREALEACDKGYGENDIHSIVTYALAKTPAQNIAKIQNETLELVVKALDKEGLWHPAIARVIHALKTGEC